MCLVNNESCQLLPTVKTAQDILELSTVVDHLWSNIDEAAHGLWLSEKVDCKPPIFRWSRAIQGKDGDILVRQS
jgi:hypothetical protein